MTRLSGKAALVTGASRGIGAAIARRLAAEGASVALTYNASPDKARAVADEIVAAGGKAIIIAADSGDPDAVRAAVAATVTAFGSIDILVSNAGIGVMGTIETATLADYDRTFDINVRGVFVAMQAAAAQMGRGGRIITIGSVNGDRTPFSGGCVYSATKAALGGLTRGVARDLGPKGITVNLVQPGPIDTDMNPANGPWAAAAVATLATGAYGTGDDVAGMVAYLASPEAGFVTGATFDIDGGYKA